MSGEPHDRLTRIGEAMVATLETHPEHILLDKAIVLLDDGELGGIAIHGYETREAALEDLMCHVKAVAESVGLNVVLAREV